MSRRLAFEFVYLLAFSLIRLEATARGTKLKIRILFGIALGSSSGAFAQTDLSMFSGSPMEAAAVRQVCDARIAADKAGYFPFCGTVIATHLGDKDFREFYEGDGNNPFLTVKQAEKFARQTDQVAALQGTSTTCLGSSVNLCLASLSSSLFVTSHPFEPEWVPGEPMVENQSPQFLGYKLPVYDELSRLDRQINREIGLGLIVAPGERVITVSIRVTLKVANLTYAAKSGLLEAMHSVSSTCGSSDDRGIQELKKVLALPLEDGDTGQFVSTKLVLCGRPAEVFKFQPKSDGLETRPQRINITFREAKAPAKPLSKGG